jgi:hypothetical protein
VPLVDQSAHIVLEKSMTYSLFAEAENRRDPEEDGVKRGGRRRSRRGRVSLNGTC